PSCEGSSSASPSRRRSVRSASCAYVGRSPTAGGPDSRSASAFVETFELTLANPATILSFVAVFAGLGIAGAGSWRDATVLVGGVFLGSALWWLLLSGVVGAVRSRLNRAALRWVNRVSGLVLLVFGVTALAWR